MATIAVRIPDDDATRLAELAAEEFRRPKDHAGVLLVAAIRREARRRARQLTDTDATSVRSSGR